MSRIDPVATLIRTAIKEALYTLGGHAGVSYNIEEAEKKMKGWRKRTPPDLGSLRSHTHPDEIAFKLDTAITLLTQARDTVAAYGGTPQGHEK